MFMVIHDLKNPTISLKNGIELILDKLQFMDSYKHFQDQMVKQKHELDKLRNEAKPKNSMIYVDNSL